jgi:hypothetical protein
MRLSRKALRRMGFTLLGLMVVLVVSAAASWAERIRNADEEYEVYSTYLSDGLQNDAHDWGASGAVLLVVKSTTSVSDNLRIKALFVFDSRVRFDRLERSIRASYLVRNLFPTRLQAKFRLPQFAAFALTSESDSYSPEFQKKFPHNQGLIVLSGVGFNRNHTQAVFYIDHFCGLCGGGRYVLMAKIGGAWRAQDEHWTWIS